MNTSLATSLVRAWATKFNREHREASVNASMWRLRFAAAFIFGALVFLAGRALAETNADAPIGKPDAVIDLATKEGVDLVKSQWRYSDTKIIQVDFKAAGTDKQPTGKPIKTYDFAPHAGVADFDDSKWEKIDPTTLDARRSTGRLCFNWYRINITIPPRVNDVDLGGATAVFQTSLDDYAELWVDGEIARAFGQSGGSVIKGWNAPNRLIINRSVQPGQKIQLAIFGINGPLSNPPTNYIWMREAKLEFYKGGIVPVAITPSEVNVEVIRKDPAIDAIVPPNPKIFKLAEGFKFTEGPVWHRKGGYLLFSDPNSNTIYKYSPDGNGALTVFREKSGYEGADIAEYGQPGSNGLTFDQQGRLTINQHGNRRVYVDNWDDHKKVVMRYEVQPDGSLKNGKLFFDMTSAGTEDALDGMKVDKAGNLYVSGPGGLWILSPQGKHLGTIIAPKHPHNFAWGDADGKTLYLCARSGLYRMKLNIKGIRP
jgi:sugar lactone lactonase YvrE